MIFKSKFVSTDNPEQNIFRRIKKSSKVKENLKALIYVFR